MHACPRTVSGRKVKDAIVTVAAFRHFVPGKPVTTLGLALQSLKAWRPIEVSITSYVFRGDPRGDL
jgi:hypothetical protein